MRMPRTLGEKHKIVDVFCGKYLGLFACHHTQIEYNMILVHSNFSANENFVRGN